MRRALTESCADQAHFLPRKSLTVLPTSRKLRILSKFKVMVGGLPALTRYGVHCVVDREGEDRVDLSRHFFRKYSVFETCERSQ
jgi:hypothetical protein